MTTTTQQLPSNPALDFANAVLAETDGGREIVLMLHDIAQGVRENATTNDRINASNILMDRGLGKCPKQAPAATSPKPNPSDDKPKAKKETKSPRLVTQLGDSLNRSFGPLPEAHPVPAQTENTPHTPVRDENQNLVSPEPFDPYSIQQHILEITNNCLTLMTVLTDIYRAPDDDPRVKDSHRVRAGRMLVDRITAMYPTAVRSAADGLVLTGDYPEHKISIQKDDEDEPFDEEVWKEIIAELKQKEEQGILTPTPTLPKSTTHTTCRPTTSISPLILMRRTRSQSRDRTAGRTPKAVARDRGAQTKETRPDLPFALRRRRRTTGNIIMSLDTETLSTLAGSLSSTTDYLMSLPYALRQDAIEIVQRGLPPTAPTPSRLFSAASPGVCPQG